MGCFNSHSQADWLVSHSDLENHEIVLQNMQVSGCLFVLTDAQEKQIEIATPGKRASHRLGCSSHPVEYEMLLFC